ncbi:MAG: hypothetical protein JWO47_398 [Candidatus Saccharibacteria bacterium]|nr:hypothetical protein [Candidatus Saccharibacteria bacterium]
MGRLSKFSPIARAVGVMGVTAGLVTGITFAALTSNTVALSPNTLSSATAHLQIGSVSEVYNDNSVTGMTATLKPGVPSSPFTFYLKNTGQSDLNVSAHVPGDFSGSAISASDITLTINCGGGDVSYTLAQWNGGSAAISANALTAGSVFTCSETATLSSSATGQGGKTVSPFSVEFTGTEVTQS